MIEGTAMRPGIDGTVRLLRARTGLVFDADRMDRVVTAIERSMARAGVADAEQYLSLLAREAISLDDLIAELTVGETYYFRDPAQFEFIRWEIISDVLGRCGANHMLRAWSAGCASGEEPYSLAILFAQEQLAERSRILATDISRVALAKARRASYGQWSLRGDGAAHARPYLNWTGREFVLDERIRRHVRFEYLNLALDAYPSLVSDTCALDLILCRNVLIYFDRETVRRVARGFYQALAPGGWLLTGASDPPLASDAPFDAIVTHAGVLYRKAAAARAVVGTSESRAPGAERTATRCENEEGERGGHVAAARGRRIPQGRVEFGRTAATPCPSNPAVLPIERPAAAPAAGARRGGLAPRSAQGIAAKAPDAVALARQALSAGNYARAIELTRPLMADATACVVRVRALAGCDAAEAERACAEAARRHRFSPELHFLHAMLLMQQRRADDAVQALRRVIYLDRSLAVAHFALAGIFRQRGDRKRSLRSYRNVLALCSSSSPDTQLALSDGERAARLAEAAKVQIELLECDPDRGRDDRAHAERGERLARIKTRAMLETTP